MRPEAAVTPEGVAISAPPCGHPGVTVTGARESGAVEYLELALTAREVEEVLIRPLSGGTERADLQRALIEAGAGAPRRCAVVVHAVIDLIPLVKAADGVEVANSKPSAPVAWLSLPELLRTLDHPFGYLIPEAGLAYRLIPARTKSRPLPGAFRHYDSTRSIWTRPQQSHRSRVDDSAVRRIERLGAAGLHPPCSLYSGGSLSVRLDAGDRLILRRIRPGWEIRQGKRICLPALELEVSAEPGPDGLPQFGLPAHIHSFPTGHTGPVCLGDWSPSNPSWAHRGLEILQRAEEVLLTPWANPRQGNAPRVPRLQRLRGRHGLLHPRRP
jgi:hypothetical protein